MYFDTLRYSTGCDSIRYTLNLTVMPVQTVTIQHEPVTVEFASEYGFNAVGSYTWYDTARYVMGCDSVVTTHYLEVLPLPEYTISVGTNNAKYGSVAGGGTFQKYDTITLTATPNKGYQFNQWSDGNTENPRQVTVTADMSFTAQFGVKMCSWLVESNDFAMGAIITTFTDTAYSYGTQISVEASPNSGYKFVKWNDGKTYNPYKFGLLEDTYLLAIFAPDNTIPEETEVHPSATSATFTWPLIVNGFTYTLIVYLDVNFTIPFCNVLFDEFGRFISRIFFKPAIRKGVQEDGTFTYTVTDLQPETEYYFQMKATNAQNQLLNTDEGAFVTKKTVTATDEIFESSTPQIIKFVRDGHLYILRDDILYNANGARME